MAYLPGFVTEFFQGCQSHSQGKNNAGLSFMTVVNRRGTLDVTVGLTGRCWRIGAWGIVG